MNKLTKLVPILGLAACVGPADPVPLCQPAGYTVIQRNPAIVPAQYDTLGMFYYTGWWCKMPTKEQRDSIEAAHGIVKKTIVLDTASSAGK